MTKAETGILLVSHRDFEKEGIPKVFKGADKGTDGHSPERMFDEGMMRTAFAKYAGIDPADLKHNLSADDMLNGADSVAAARDRTRKFAGIETGLNVLGFSATAGYAAAAFTSASSPLQAAGYLAASAALGAISLVGAGISVRDNEVRLATLGYRAPAWERKGAPS